MLVLSIGSISHPHLRSSGFKHRLDNSLYSGEDVEVRRGVEKLLEGKK